MDASDILDAGYALESTFATWCDDLLARAAPHLDLGLGVVLFVIEHDGPDGPTISANHTVGCAASLVDRLASALLESGGVHAASLGDAGVVEVWTMTLHDDTHKTLYLIAPSAQPIASSRTRKSTWDAVTSHLGRGLALHGRLTRSGARALVVHLAQAKREPTPTRVSAPSWDDVSQGRWSIVTRVEYDSRRWLVACANPADLADPRRLTPREDEAARLAMTGEAMKVIASDLDVATVTAAALVSRAMKKLGAITRGDLLALARLGPGFVLAPVDVRLVAFPEPRAKAVDGQLPRSEHAVAALSVQGLSNQEIAARLGRSVRTVANQLSSVYKKLRLASRNELAAWWRAMPTDSSSKRSS